MYTFLQNKFPMCSSEGIRRKGALLVRLTLVALLTFVMSFTATAGETVDIQVRLLQGPARDLQAGDTGILRFEFINLGSTTQRVTLGTEALPEFETPLLLRGVEGGVPHVCALGMDVTDAGTIAFNGNVGTLAPSEVTTCDYEYEVIFQPSTSTFAVQFRRGVPFNDQNSDNDRVLITFQFAGGGDGRVEPIAAPIGGFWFTALTLLGLLALARKHAIKRL